MLFIFVPEVIN